MLAIALVLGAGALDDAAGALDGATGSRGRWRGAVVDVDVALDVAALAVLADGSCR